MNGIEGSTYDVEGSQELIRRRAIQSSYYISHSSEELRFLHRSGETHNLTFHSIYLSLGGEKVVGVSSVATCLNDTGYRLSYLSICIVVTNTGEACR